MTMKTCPYCNSPNELERTHCKSCAGPLTGAQIVETPQEQPKPLPFDAVLSRHVDVWGNKVTFTLTAWGIRQDHTIDLDELRISHRLHYVTDLAPYIIGRLATAFKVNPRDLEASFRYRSEESVWIRPNSR